MPKKIVGVHAATDHVVPNDAATDPRESDPAELQDLADCVSVQKVQSFNNEKVKRWAAPATGRTRTKEDPSMGSNHGKRASSVRDLWRGAGQR